MKFKFTEEEVKHYFLPIPKVIYSYVVTNKDKEVTDFLSFYSLPSHIMKHEKYKTLNVSAGAILGLLFVLQLR